MTRAFRKFLLPLLPVLAFFLGSCASYSHYRFGPQVQDVEVRASADDVLARVLVAPRGIGRRETFGGERLEVQFRLKVENLTESEISIDPAELTLVDGNLEAFGPVEVVPSDSGEEGVFTVGFPFPPRRQPADMNLGSLRMRIGLRRDNDLFTTGATFEREPGYDSYYYPDYRWNVGFRYGYGFRRGFGRSFCY